MLLLFCDERIMTRVSFNVFHSIIVYLTIVSVVNAALQDFINLQHRKSHLSDTKFGYDAYSEYPDNDEREHGPESQWDRIPQRNIQPLRFSHTSTESSRSLPDSLDPNIAWDTHWGSDMPFGQLSAIDMDPKGRIVIFSRRERIWGLRTFDDTNKFDPGNGPIKDNTIIVLDRTGRKILEWGSNMFYMPHGLTIDNEGNYWMTDVALHQVFKFDAKDIEKNWDLLKRAENETNIGLIDIRDYDSRFNQSILRPSMTLGEAFQPGDDNRRFCKPTAVAVAQNGDFFVSDGYCNSRIVKFNKKGEKILHWGRPWPIRDNLNKSPPSYVLVVPHSLALAEDQNTLYVADREDGRVMSYSAQDGTFYREYKNPLFGPKVYGIAYAREKIYLVNGQDNSPHFHVRGYVVDTTSGMVVSQFAPGRDDMLAPHDIAVSNDGSEIYVVELGAHKAYRFTQSTSKKILSHVTLTGNTTSNMRPHREFIPLTDASVGNVSAGQTGTGPLVLSILISAMIFIGLCLAVAAVVARCQKRGCLLSVRRRAYWEAERRENFKLSSLLETRQGKTSFKIIDKRPNTRDFSKLNTEPETSEDERVEDSLVI